jgi:septal ring factor EnvC (AmiA/AmiB activator)
MNNLTVALLTLASAILSGFGVNLFTSIQENKKEKIRQNEREQDLLKIDLKDLEIKLYKIERELYEWKDKYYSAIQELIEVKSELEQTLIKLSLIHLEHQED